MKVTEQHKTLKIRAKSTDEERRMAQLRRAISQAAKPDNVSKQNKPLASLLAVQIIPSPSKPIKSAPDTANDNAWMGSSIGKFRQSKKCELTLLRN